ncbi:MAG: hypothetical protein JJT76_16825 [Clostridiaceae bacterium]|nr:hypothetical protein [Clostridiaceae bacterium]
MKNNKKKETKKSNNPIANSRNKTPQELYNMGKTSYVWGHGVLSWGVSTGIIFMILTGIHQYRFSPRLILRHTFGLSGLLTIFMFAAVGFLWGSFMWRVICKKVEKDNSGDTKGNKKNNKTNNKTNKK